MTTEPDDDQLAVLVEHLTRASDDAPGLANAALTAFQRGLPVDRLAALLEHPDPEVVAVGTWIAAELGAAAAPLADHLPTLLTSPSREVRFYAVDVALSVAVGTSAGLAALVLPLLDDPDVAVRWKAMGFLGRASTAQLSAALDAAGRTEPGAPGLRWLLSPEGRDPAAVRDRLADDDGRTRRYAAAAAARLADVTEEPLRAAAVAADDEVRRFAQDWLAATRT